MLKKNVPLFIAFEGVDKSGKTTLMRKFNEKTNYKYLCVDRFLISSLVYDRIFNRGRRKYFKKLFKKTRKMNVVIVYCNCKNDIIIDRLNWFKEELPNELKDIDKVKKCFIEEIEDNIDYIAGVVEALTDGGDIDYCVKSVIKKVEEIEKGIFEQL